MWHNKKVDFSYVYSSHLILYITYTDMYVCVQATRHCCEYIKLFVMNTSGTFSFSVFYGILINFIRYNDRVTAIY